MTDDELRRALAERLYWMECGDAPTDLPITGDRKLPSLSELVATGEGRLTESQQVRYASAVINEVDPLWEHNEDLCACFRLITAPIAVRAMALLETLDDKPKPV